MLTTMCVCVCVCMGGCLWQLHPALQRRGPGVDAETDYLRGVVAQTLPLLVGSSDHSSAIVRLLLREVLAGRVVRSWARSAAPCARVLKKCVGWRQLAPALALGADPEYLNYYLDLWVRRRTHKATRGRGTRTDGPEGGRGDGHVRPPAS
jgi:hypothetical protein